MTVTNSQRKPNRRERKTAKELIRTGTKVWLYKKDKLPPIEERALKIAIDGLRDVLNKRNTLAEILEKKARILDEALRKSGGQFYHKKNWVENVEMLLVAAIVILGIRSFFCSALYYPNQFHVSIFLWYDPIYL